MKSEKAQVAAPKGWLKKELGEVCLKVSKIDPSDLGREIFKYVDIGSINSATNTVASPQILSVKDAPGRARQLVQEGDTVFSTVRPYMKNIAYINESLDGEIASTGFCVIRANTEFVSKGFIKFFSSSDNLLEQILPLQRGVSYPAVRDKDLFSASVLVPPLIEQQKIVEILEEQLSRLDAALASVNAVCKKAARFRRSLLHAAFTGALTGHDSFAGTLPEGWQVKLLSELCEQGKDSIVDGPFGSNLKRSDFQESGIPVLKLQNIKANFIIQKNMDYVSQDKYEKIKRHSFHLGDIVMTKLGNPLGVSAIVDDISFGVIVADLVRIRPNNVDTKFLCYYLNSPLIAKYLNDNQKGTTRPRINLSIVRSLILNIPPLDEQIKIVEILEEQISHLDTALAIADAIERKTTAMRRSLLHAAFTGELTKEWRREVHV